MPNREKWIDILEALERSIGQNAMLMQNCTIRSFIFVQGNVFHRNPCKYTYTIYLLKRLFLIKGFQILESDFFYFERGIDWKENILEVFDLDQINVQLLQKLINSNDIFSMYYFYMCSMYLGESNGCTDICKNRKVLPKMTILPIWKRNYPKAAKLRSLS